MQKGIFKQRNKLNTERALSNSNFNTSTGRNSIEPGMLETKS